ncbi:multiple sugar transport system substrate-binding protein [Arthrobacter sp. PL16]|uniref:ABC transporter substrate-binding protein n=1 Tax=Arthrobacter sp. PL16 TaxID=3071720 RepID=UPI002E036067|nr:multiple sugar transport system substrate-binding protein [Arthrobacter sp. PL16]
MRHRYAAFCSVMTVALLGITACSGSSGDASSETDQLTVWTTEDLPDRVASQQAIMDQFSESSGIEVELVAIAEDQLTSVLSSSAASGELPDVIGALSLNGMNQLSTDGLLDTSAAAAVVEELGADTFSPRSLELTSSDGEQLSVPSDAFAQLLFYRQDLFEQAGLDAPTTFEAIERAAQALHTDELAGIVAATAPADSFTQQTFEQFALANGCELVGDDGSVTLNSDQCQESLTFYSALLRDYSVPGNQDADTTRASYFAGDAAMTVWSSFLLDELAGLRSDALPTCAECADDPAFLADNTGIVTAIQGPDGEQPAGYGEIVSWNILNDAAPAAQDLVTFMMGDGYQDWLAVAPEGKIPVRLGTADNPTEFTDAWQGLEAGVDSKALLSSIYAPETLAEISQSTNQFKRWGIPQGQGALAAAVSGQFIAPQIIASMVSSGTSGEEAASQAQDEAESLQADLGQ